MKRIDLIAGARPNFVKIASIAGAIADFQARGHDVSFRLVHTGQHFDPVMSDAFFEELQIPAPDVNLGVRGGSIAEVTSAIMVGYENLLANARPDCCLVVGDVTSTMACAIAAKRANVPLAHVEAGIRSYDMRMPEEINRIVTDAITDWFFTTSRWAGENLTKTGVPRERIFFVGNTMIDTLLKHREKFRLPHGREFAGLRHRGYLVLTLHRPSNVDDTTRLREIVEAVCHGADQVPVVFPVHPRTMRSIASIAAEWPVNLRLTQALPYLAFNGLVGESLGVLTDSGGITEEATVMGIPCGTIRESTERPETVEQGTNELLGTGADRIRDASARMAAGTWKKGTVPELWDGRSGARIVDHLWRLLNDAQAIETGVRR